LYTLSNGDIAVESLNVRPMCR